MSRSGPNTEHDEVIDFLCLTDNYIKRSKFYSTIKKVMDDPYCNRNVGIVPDAHKYCGFCKTMHTYEVENKSQIDKRRLLLYSNLWEYLDCENMSLCLHVVDRFGNEVRTVYGGEEWSNLFMLFVQESTKGEQRELG